MRRSTGILLDIACLAILFLIAIAGYTGGRGTLSQERIQQVSLTVLVTVLLFSEFRQSRVEGKNSPAWFVLLVLSWVSTFGVVSVSITGPPTPALNKLYSVVAFISLLVFVCWALVTPVTNDHSRLLHRILLGVGISVVIYSAISLALLHYDFSLHRNRDQLAELREWFSRAQLFAYLFTVTWVIGPKLATRGTAMNLGTDGN